MKSFLSFSFMSLVKLNCLNNMHRLKFIYLFIYILTMHYAKSRAINITKAIKIKQCKQAIEIISGRNRLKPTIYFHKLIKTKLML